MGAVLLHAYMCGRKPPPSINCPSSTTTHTTHAGGYEQPPTVETRRMLFFGGERWVSVKTCDQSRPTRLTNIINDNLERSIPGFPEPTTHNKNDNFILYVGAKENEGDGLYTNMDATYLMSLGYQGAPGLDYSSEWGGRGCCAGMGGGAVGRGGGRKCMVILSGMCVCIAAGQTRVWCACDGVCVLISSSQDTHVLLPPLHTHPSL